jgi:DNA-binding NtrC family response regulator
MTRSSLKREPVLVVEDNPALVNLISLALQNAGFEVVSAASSADGCAAIDARRFSLVLLDWNLNNSRTASGQDITGLEVLKHCREVDPFLPVVVMSGENESGAMAGATLGEADCFLPKPLSLNLLIDHATRWLKWHGGTRQGLKFSTQCGAVPTDEVRRCYAGWSMC